MMHKMIAAKQAVQKNNPLIHCLTNHITSYACANSILAIGAQPIMAEHPREVAEITVGANALLLNLGNISDSRMQAMHISAAVANKKNIPIVLDAVGVSCSKMRLDFVKQLLEKYTIAIVKGNTAEISALLTNTCTARGVDADKPLTLTDRSVSDFAYKQQCIVLMSGATDLVTDGKQIAHIQNGHPMLSRITGTGCMLGALVATLCSYAPAFTAAMAGAVLLGIAGEEGAKSDSLIGTGTFLVNLQDQLCLLSDEALIHRSKYTLKGITT